MIKKTLLFAFILLVGYNFLSKVFLGDHSISQYQLQSNLINAQEYIYDGKKHQTVMIGSSMGTEIKLSPNRYNLCLSGGSAFTGIRIIKLKKELPDTILIETNVLSRMADDRMLNSLDVPVLKYLRTQFPCLLEKNQPVTYLSARLQPLMNHVVTMPRNYFYSRMNKSVDNQKLQKTEKEVSRHDLFNKMLEIHRKKYNELEDSLLIKSNLTAFIEDVNDLRSRGVKIIFLELPMDSSLTNSKLMSYQRGILKTSFTNMKDGWVPIDSYNYETLDGLHLTDSSARHYNRYMSDYLASLK
jgi:hypothetical protein